MLTPKSSSYYNGKCSISFTNSEYLKKPQWEKPCLYNVQYDKNDLVNMFAPESEEIIRLAKESQSKLGDLVKPYDYTKLNNLCDLFVPQQHKSREQLYLANVVRKNIFKTPFKRQTTHLVKRIEYLPTKASMSTSKQMFNNIMINIEHIRSVVELNWKSRVQYEWNNPITHDVKVLVKEILIFLAQDIIANASLFETHLKKEMFEDLKYVKSLEKEADDHKKDFYDFKS
ncbi:hypothetical protein Tco_1311827 [Tanacetum coccineum]